MQPVLIMIQGPEPGRVYRLPENRVTTLGRSERNSVPVPSPTVSRFHCEIACVNGRWELSDLNSRKGTLVDGERIEGKRTLSSGQLIRLSSTIFRFELMAEGEVQDTLLMAVEEPGVRQAAFWSGRIGRLLDHLRWEGRRAVVVNLAFLAAVVATVGSVTGGLLAYARSRAERPVAQGARPEQRAQRAYDDALAALGAGDKTRALGKLEQVERDFAGTAAAGRAAQTRTETFWAVLQETLSTVAAREADNDHAAALGLQQELQRLHPPPSATGLLQQRRQYTVRLAHASFRAVEQSAGRLAAKGDVEGALKLYRRAHDRIGVPELAAEAQLRMAELETGGDG